MNNNGAKLEGFIKNYLTVCNNKNQLRELENSYDDEFKQEGRKKSQYILDDLQSRENKGVRLEDLIYFSVGGSDGSEVISILENTKIENAIMIEYSNSASDTAKESAKKLKEKYPYKTFHVICGDANDRLDEALNTIKGWQIKNSNLDGLILSCQAVLHELPRRSNNYQHSKFIGKVFRSKKLNTKAIYIREPCFPENWRSYENIFIKIPGVEGTSLENFASHVSEKLDIKSDITRVNDGYLSLSPELAVETLHKLIRKNSIQRTSYELEEQLTSFNVKKFVDLASKSIGGECRTVPCQTGGFQEALKHFNVKFRSGGSRTKLDDPQSHIYITGFHTVKKKEEPIKLNENLSPDQNKAKNDGVINKTSLRHEDSLIAGVKIEKMPIIEVFDSPLLKTDVVTEIDNTHKIPQYLNNYFKQNINKHVKEELANGKAITNGKGYGLRKIIIQKDQDPKGGRRTRPHLIFENAEYYHQLMFSERLDTQNLINGKSIRNTFAINFNNFDWSMVEKIPIPQRFANVIGVILPVSREKPHDLCLVIAIRSTQSLVRDKANKNCIQASLSCAEGMLRPDDAEPKMNERFAPSPFNTAIRSLKEELNVEIGIDFLEKDLKMLALGYDSNRCQPVAVFNVKTVQISFVELIDKWLKAKDRHENRDLIPIRLNLTEYRKFLKGDICYENSPVKLFSNHQLLGACVIGKYYFGKL